ncbi:CapA family protein [Streptomyces sp. 4N509B]|uniref:CapA family protein n=1 Tax=Streptomyces sp. 4N509B TaxID=3457413 RepID=UPI003FD463EF
MSGSDDGVLGLLLCGDVMLGRGVDQVLPHPGDPALREAYVPDAREYVALAESVSGPVAQPVGYDWPWGEALAALDEFAPDVRVLNLETAVTTAGDFAPGKAVHYRMHPANVPCLTAARPDVCVLANNHVLDFGRAGLTETLDTLAGAGLRTAGAGRDAAQAWRPATVPLPGAPEGRRLLVLAFGSPSSGVPPGWAAGAGRPGVAYVPRLTGRAAARITAHVRRLRRPGDLVVASVHWGSNWGYEVAADQVGFAHALVDGGVDVVHGHSSHHPRPLEIYRGRPILYGCGDLVDDYEGIGGHEAYRDELRLLYLLPLDRDTGRLAGDVRLLPLRARRLSLTRASGAETAWLHATLGAASRRFGTRVELDGATGVLTAGPA